MDRNEKRRFIEDLTASIREELINKIPHMPEEWDGIELRDYLADKFAECSILHNRLWKPPRRKEYRRRSKDYENEVITRNL